MLQRTLVEQQRARDYERFQDYSEWQMRQDEITSAGEHLPAHGYYKIHLKRRGDDFIDERDPDPTKWVSLLDTVTLAHERYAEVAKHSPELSWQAERSRYEVEHIKHMLHMPPNSLRFVISDCPVKELTALGRSEFGYDLERRLGFMQALHVDEKGDLNLHGHTVDLDDLEGKQAVFAMFGRELQENQWSIEQPIDEIGVEGVNVQELLERALATYDNELYKKTGTEWFAGRDRASIREEANEFVRQQSDLLDAHVVKLKLANPKSAAANQLRYNFVKAVRDRYMGITHVTVEGGSVSADTEMSMAGDSARDRGETASFCGITIEAQQNTSLTESLERIGMSRREWKHGSCRNCKDVFNPQKIVGECDVCKHCEHADNNGRLEQTAKQAEDILRQQQIQQETASRASSELSQEIMKQKTNQVSDIRRVFGEMATVRTVYVWGGAEKVVFNKLTNEELGKL